MVKFNIITIVIDFNNMETIQIIEEEDEVVGTIMISISIMKIEDLTNIIIATVEVQIDIMTM